MQHATVPFPPRHLYVLPPQLPLHSSGTSLEVPGIHIEPLYNSSGGRQRGRGNKGRGEGEEGKGGGEGGKGREETVEWESEMKKEGREETRLKKIKKWRWMEAAGHDRTRNTHIALAKDALCEMRESTADWAHLISPPGHPASAPSPAAG